MVAHVSPELVAGRRGWWLFPPRGKHLWLVLEKSNDPSRVRIFGYEHGDVNIREICEKKITQIAIVQET